MPLPPLLRLPDDKAYRLHFRREYVSGPPVVTSDGIRVLFYDNQFDHAFYRAITRRGPKSVFDLTRAERIDWIRWALQERSLEVYRRVMTGTATRRIVLEPITPYLVTCELLSTNPAKAVFITAYVVDDPQTLPKIRGNPQW